MATVTVRATINAPPVSKDGLELLIVVAALPRTMAEAAFPKGLLVLTATLAPAINAPALIVVVPVYALEPDRVSDPSPLLTRLPVVAVLAPVMVRLEGYQKY